MVVALETFRDETVVIAVTVRLFWIVAADTVRSPLILVAFEMFKDDKVATEFPAEMFPITVREF